MTIQTISLTLGCAMASIEFVFATCAPRNGLRVSLSSCGIRAARTVQSEQDRAAHSRKRET